LLAVGGHLLGNVDSQAIKMASTFAGGVGGTREEMCGALSGGVMVIGALFGRTTLSEAEELARSLAARYRHRFQEEFGTTQCSSLYDHMHAVAGSGSCALVGERAAKLLLDVLANDIRMGDETR
jgi:C_GCAxxG_C_C family probable redox protein